MMKELLSQLRLFPLFLVRLLMMLWLFQPVYCPRLFTAETIQWYLPTRLTTYVPCFTAKMINPDRAVVAERSSIALYRWIQENGNIIGSGYKQVVRLLRMPDNQRSIFHTMKIICIAFNWDAVATGTFTHEINFYEGPTITGVATVSFRFQQNLTEFLGYLTNNPFFTEWCLNEKQCYQALVAEVRDPELEYPHLINLAFEYQSINTPVPLITHLEKLRQASQAGSGTSAPMFHLNFVLRLQQFRTLKDLCNPLDVSCSDKLSKKRAQVVADFGNAALQALDRFAEERAAARKLQTMDQSLLQSPEDALNFTIRFDSINICPLGYGQINISTERHYENYEHNVSTLVCGACPPGTFGSNGLTCFPVMKNFYTDEYGSAVLTPCPDKYVTYRTKSYHRSQCFYNGTTVEIFVMELMEAAWEEIARIYYESTPTPTIILIIVYLIVTSYGMFWQLHRFITLIQLRRRRGLSDRLLKRFVAEAYLRDLRRLQYWRAAISAATENQEEQQYKIVRVRR